MEMQRLRDRQIRQKSRNGPVRLSGCHWAEGTEQKDNKLECFQPNDTFLFLIVPIIETLHTSLHSPL